MYSPALRMPFSLPGGICSPRERSTKSGNGSVRPPRSDRSGQGSCWPFCKTPHRFRTKRQLWNYGGLAIEMHSSAVTIRSRIELADSFVLSDDPVGTRWEGTPARGLFHRRQISQSTPHFSRLVEAHVWSRTAQRNEIAKEIPAGHLTTALPQVVAWRRNEYALYALAEISPKMPNVAGNAMRGLRGHRSQKDGHILIGQSQILRKGT